MMSARPKPERKLVGENFRTGEKQAVPLFVVRHSSLIRASSLKQVSHFHALGLKIFGVMRIGFAPD
jgi:hypothetical protein